MNFKPEWIVYAAMAIPVLWVWMEIEQSALILAAIVAGGMVYFHDNFIHKSAVEKKEPLDLGKETERERRPEPPLPPQPPTVRYNNFPKR